MTLDVSHSVAVLKGNFREGSILQSSSSNDFIKSSVSTEIYGYDSDSDLESEWDDEEESSSPQPHAADSSASILSSISPEENGSSMETVRAVKKPEQTTQATHRLVHMQDTAAQTCAMKAKLTWTRS